MRGRFEPEPEQRLTRLCDAMIATLEVHPEHGADVHCVVFLDDGDTGGLVMHGYEGNDREISAAALTDVFLHMKAIFEANGSTLALVPFPGQG